MKRTILAIVAALLSSTGHAASPEAVAWAQKYLAERPTGPLAARAFRVLVRAMPDRPVGCPPDVPAKLCDVVAQMY
jgi:hypothetical protein